MKIVDTNILLDYPQVIEEEKDLLILTDVLKELDGLKRSPNNETAFQARRAAITISRNIDVLCFFNNVENENIPVDDKLIKVAKKLDIEIITNDVYLKIRAQAAGAKVESYGVKDNYSGVVEFVIETDENGYNETLDYILQNKEFPKDFYPKKIYENQYFIIKNKQAQIQKINGELDYEVLSTFCCRQGKLETIDNWENKVIANKWINKISPRNPEQLCLFHALFNRKISIVYAGGQFGTGY